LGAELPEGFGDYFIDRTERVTGGATQLDWRNYSGQNFVSPTLNQGRCGSCVAFAVIGALETQMNIARMTTTSPWSYSPQHLFSCGGATCETGWRPGNAMSFLKKEGVPDESCFPYQSGAKGEDVACKKTC
jgi:C1A family cysteine protease